ncbi:PRC-barrel domain containing protein [Streptomyces sp. NBC_00878]|uniref:PRC-barrel domain containing protein n=1 Tax=Streptomyces sp. NBC_00878 TaxID=2975854 RepID=UPI0022599DDE|nr:PRC-barrel domain containing protein [Streptomyces sp. NBC_00878]MCX4911382.1 PRC-barrel domain containing protein [Streptomyces sp. NBC_00878]
MGTDRIWSYAVDSGHTEGQRLAGFTVVAADGTMGHVGRQADGSGWRHLIVDTGVWLFGSSVLIPAGLVTAVDVKAQQVRVACTAEEIKRAPRFKTDRETLDPEYLAGVGDYYRNLPPRQASAS